MGLSFHLAPAHTASCSRSRPNFDHEISNKSIASPFCLFTCRLYDDRMQKQLSHVSALVVDDSSTMRTLIREMLRQLGVRLIEEACDGEEALRKVAASRFDVIISDWHMERMDGLDLLKHVRKISHPNYNRFIFVTSERSWGHQTTARIEGAEAFLSKPFKLETLKSKLFLVLRLSQ